MSTTSSTRSPLATVATHLSQLRTAYGDPALTTRLTLLVAEAHGVVHGARTRPGLA